MKSIFNIKSLVLCCLMAGVVFSLAGCEEKADARSRMGDMDIVETASSSGNFNTLVAALEAADLADTLKGDGPFTVFAPTDQAFEKLGKRKLDDLLKPENKDKLASILTYHVVPGDVSSSEVVRLSSAETVNGKQVHIKAKNGMVMIDDARVIQTDIPCTNGVIHVIDTVLTP